MFRSARFELTLWYLLIIMSISIIFSSVIYFTVSRDIENEYRRFSMRVMENQEFIPGPLRVPVVNSEVLTAAKNRLKFNLFYILFEENCPDIGVLCRYLDYMGGA